MKIIFKCRSQLFANCDSTFIAFGLCLSLTKQYETFEVNVFISGFMDPEFVFSAISPLMADN